LSRDQVISVEDPLPRSVNRRGWRFESSNGPIAFAGDQSGGPEIYRMRQDGTHVRRLTHTAAGKESVFSHWSPDGRSIAFDSDRRGDQLFVMDQNGGQVRHRVTRRSLDAGHPSWSPDGSRIIFSD
jgi:Tol biopolymer transport system component